MSTWDWPRLRRFVERHIGKVVTGAIAIPLFIKLTGWAAKRYLTYQANRTHEIFLRYKKQRMFELMEESFEPTFRKWFELMKENMKEVIDPEKFMEQLKNQEGNKYLNWMELKISAFASILTLVYGSSLLTVLLRVQTNVISGMLFKQMEDVPPGLEEFGAGDNERLEDRLITDDVQQQYMMLTRYLCTDGIKHLCRLMCEKTWQQLANVSLKQKVSASDVIQIFTSIRNTRLQYQMMNFGITDGIDEAQNNDWCPITEAWYFMVTLQNMKKFFKPTVAQYCAMTTKDVVLQTLIGEAYDLVNSEDTKNLLKFLEAQGLNNYFDRITEYLNSLPTSPESDESQISEDVPISIQEISFTEPNAPLAKILPLMNSFITVPFSEDTWISVLLNNESLKAFSANIYESYSAKDEFY